MSDKENSQKQELVNMTMYTDLKYSVVSPDTISIFPLSH